MPFKKINATEIVQEKMDKDKEFKSAYNKTKTEYRLIREIVKNVGIYIL